MSQLLRCVECSHAVASNASSCPACKSGKPFGEACAVCGVRSKSRDLTVVCGGMGRGSWSRHYHSTCVGAVLSKFRPICRTCHVDLHSQPQAKLLAQDFSCPNCGEREPFGDRRSCSKCWLPMYGEAPIKHTRRVPHEHEADEYVEGHYHSACVPPSEVARGGGCLLVPAITIACVLELLRYVR